MVAVLNPGQGVFAGVCRDLTPVEKAAVDAILHYDFGGVRKKLLLDVNTPAHQVDVAIAEFRRFLILIRLGWNQISMTNHLVDEVWHAFILFTQNYVAFCDKVFGSYLHHTPGTVATPSQVAESVRNFREVYQTVFGQVPNIWLETHKDGATALLCAPTSRLCGPTAPMQ